jgi:hypothetical protein
MVSIISVPTARPVTCVNAAPAARADMSGHWLGAFYSLPFAAASPVGAGKIRDVAGAGDFADSVCEICIGCNKV